MKRYASLFMILILAAALCIFSGACSSSGTDEDGSAAKMQTEGIKDEGGNGEADDASEDGMTDDSGSIKSAEKTAGESDNAGKTRDGESVDNGAKSGVEPSSQGSKAGDEGQGRQEKSSGEATGQPLNNPPPVEPQDVKTGKKEYTCSLSVRCDVIKKNIDDLNPQKTELIPSDGVIFSSSSVTFYEGESVFNVLSREMKKAKIHMESKSTPIYNSSYIMGINNIYEFDCGELSGWVYKVNGWFPNYGSSRYQLKDKDAIEVLYTCDLGRDVGATGLENWQQ